MGRWSILQRKFFPMKLKLADSVMLNASWSAISLGSKSLEMRKPIKELTLQSARQRLSSLLDHINYLAEKDAVYYYFFGNTVHKSNTPK